MCLSVCRCIHLLSVCDACLMLQVASAGDVLSMTREGTGGAFVNSHGYVHDMITLNRATNTSCEGEAETEHSWFPGYAWTIAYCAGCMNHLVRLKQPLPSTLACLGSSDHE